MVEAITFSPTCGKMAPTCGIPPICGLEVTRVWIGNIFMHYLSFWTRENFKMVCCDVLLNYYFLSFYIHFEIY